MKIRILRQILLCLLAAIAFKSHAEELQLVPPGEPVAGISQVDWSRMWWQWAASFDGASSPVSDRTGRNCHLKQEGQVWFLAGAYGSQRVERTCKVPAGKYLFFPLLNYVVYPRDQAQTSPCSSLEQQAKLMTDGVAVLVLDLNGMRATGLNGHRQATVNCFDLGARTIPRVAPLRAAANGYYVMLRPLKPGQYDLNFGGVLPELVQAITYHLTVE